MAQYESPKPNRTVPCVIFGCLGAVVLIVAVIALVAFMVYRITSGIVETATDTEAMELPPTNVTDADYAEAKARVESFQAALENGQPTAPLNLTSDDINAMIQFDPEWAFVKDHMRVEIIEDRVTGQVSVPLDMLSEKIALPGMGMFKGRYFNGTAEFDIFMRSGVLYVHLVDLSIKGEPIPEEFTMEMQKQNLAEDFNRQGHYGPVMQAIETVEVKDGVVTIIPKNSIGAEGSPVLEEPVEQPATAGV